MNHLDEGTIHAWLDGALDARQAADVETHVGQCSACAAKVAEARGLVAASSRILIALDDVPAGVTPKPAAAPAPKVRRWASSGWVTGVAAALVLVALWRTTGIERSRARTADIDLSALDSIAVITLPSTPSMPAAPPVSPPLPIVDAPLAGPPERPVQQRASVGAAAGSGAAGAAVTTGVRATAAEPAARVGAAAVVADTSRVPGLSEMPARTEIARAESRSDAKPAESAKDAVDSRASWAGCYRVPAVMSKTPSEAMASANLASEARSRRASSGAPAPAAAPPAARAPEEQKASFAAPAVLSLVRLDSAGRILGIAVRPAGERPDSAIGRWSEVKADSARAVVLSRGAFMLAKRDRVACPE